MSNPFEIKIWDPNDDEITSQFLDVLCLAYNTKMYLQKSLFSGRIVITLLEAQLFRMP